MKMFRNKDIPVYNVILWDINNNDIEYYNIMPYLIDCWKEDKKKRYKMWDYQHKFSKDDTRMPEKFDEFRDFIIKHSRYQFWSRCEYEIIVRSWPTGNNERKIDAFIQIMQNIDVITGLFMNFINSKRRNVKDEKKNKQLP